MEECYKYAVGLSQDDCECTEANRPLDYNTSHSGLFLDDLSLISDLISYQNCAKNMWSMFERQIELATSLLIADSNALMGKKFKLKKQPAMGQSIAKTKSRDLVTQDMNYAYLRMACNPVQGGYFCLKALGGIFSAAGVVNVQVYDNVEGYLFDMDINTLANKYSKTATTRELPLYSKYVDTLEYCFVYLMDPANIAKDNEISCGCGSKDIRFNLDQPVYKYSGAKRKSKWYDFAMFGGGQINSLSELDDFEDLPSSLPLTGMGLNLEGDFTCKISEVLCEDSLDFIGNPLALSQALAIKYKAGALVAAKIRKNPKPGEHNQISAEDWEDSEIEWNEKYNEHVNYIVSEIDHTANDCFTCKDLLGMTRQGLFG